MVPRDLRRRGFGTLAPAREQKHRRRQHERRQISRDESEILVRDRAIGEIDAVGQVDEWLEAVAEQPGQMRQEDKDGDCRRNIGCGGGEIAPPRIMRERRKKAGGDQDGTEIFRQDRKACEQTADGGVAHHARFDRAHEEVKRPGPDRQQDRVGVEALCIELVEGRQHQQQDAKQLQATVAEPPDQRPGAGKAQRAVQFAQQQEGEIAARHDGKPGARHP